jgi:hypothetical protein
MREVNLFVVGIENFRFRHRVQEFRSSGVQEFRSSGVQEFRSSGVQEFRSSGVQEFRSSGKSKLEITTLVKDFQPCPEVGQRAVSCWNKGAPSRLSCLLLPILLIPCIHSRNHPSICALVGMRPTLLS